MLLTIVGSSVVETITELGVDVVVAVLEPTAVVETKEESLYNSSLSPAPQYWY